MESINISLPEPLKQFVEGQVAEGPYGSVSEYVGALIHANERRKAEDQTEALLLGIQQGEARPLI